MGFNAYDKDHAPRGTYAEHIVVSPEDAVALAMRFETEQYATGMAFSYAQTVAASRALRAYADSLNKVPSEQQRREREVELVAQAIAPDVWSTDPSVFGGDKSNMRKSHEELKAGIRERARAVLKVISKNRQVLSEAEQAEKIRAEDEREEALANGQFGVGA